MSLPCGPMANRYAAIGDYGVIGDLYTVALVGMDGSIDFLCLPHFDSPSVFAALVDAGRGGRFKVKTTLLAAMQREDLDEDALVRWRDGRTTRKPPSRRVEGATRAGASSSCSGLPNGESRLEEAA